jgi:cobalamin synthase
MKDLNKKVFAGLPVPILILAALLFLPAWTLDYWQAWVFLAVFSMSMLAIVIYLVKMDPGLLERRLKMAEKQRSQKMIKCCLVMAFIATIVFPAIDHRFAWSSVSPCVVAAGDVLVATGCLIIFFVFKETPSPQGLSKSPRTKKSSRQDCTRWCDIRCTVDVLSCFPACLPPWGRGGDCLG